MGQVRDLFTLDVIVGYVLPVQDETWLFPTVSLKLLDFPSLTVSCISPEKQQRLKETFQSYPPSVIVNKVSIKDSQSRIVFKKGKSCSFKLSKEEIQQLYLPLIVTLTDSWYFPAKHLGKTHVDILVPHLQYKSSIVPVSKLKQIYELCNSEGTKVAMIQLSYKLRRVIDSLSDSKVTTQVQQSKVVDKSSQVKVTSSSKSSKLTTTDPLPKSTELRTICPPPLFYTSSSDHVSDGNNKAQVVSRPDQDLMEVVWPNGYVHSEPTTEYWGGDQYHNVLLPSSDQPSAVPVHEDTTPAVAVDKDHDFLVLRALMKELSVMEQFLGSKAATKECSDAYVQTEGMSNNEETPPAPSKPVVKKSGKLRRKFIRECCTKSPKSHVPKSSPAKHSCLPGRHHKLNSPRDRKVSSVLNDNKVEKVKTKSPLQQKLPKKHVNPYQNGQAEPVSQISEQFFVNTSMEHTSDQSKLNLDIHMPTLTKIPSTTSVGLEHRQDDSIPMSHYNSQVALSVESPAPVTSLNDAATALLKVQSAIPSGPASQPDHLIVAMPADLQSYSNLSLSTNSVVSEDPLNQSHISNLMFSTKHLEAALSRCPSAKDQPSSFVPLDTVSTTDNTNHTTTNTTRHSSSASDQYQDDFEDDTDHSSPDGAPSSTNS